MFKLKFVQIRICSNLNLFRFEFVQTQFCLDLNLFKLDFVEIRIYPNSILFKLEFVHILKLNKFGRICSRREAMGEETLNGPGPSNSREKNDVGVNRKFDKQRAD
jgi:hypothetical protein